MNWGILAFVIIYEVLTVLVVGAIIARKNKQVGEEGNFAFAGNGLFRTEGHASCAGMTPSLCTCRAGERSALQDLLFPSVGFERVFNIQGGGVDVSVRFRGVVVPVWGLGSDVSDRMRQYCREIKGIKI